MLSSLFDLELLTASFVVSFFHSSLYHLLYLDFGQVLFIWSIFHLPPFIHPFTQASTLYMERVNLRLSWALLSIPFSTSSKVQVNHFLFRPLSLPFRGLRARATEHRIGLL